MAIGAANDAARRRAAEQRRAEQAARQQAQAAAQQRQQAADNHARQRQASSIPRYLFTAPVSRCISVTYDPHVEPSYWLHDTCSFDLNYDWATPSGKWGTGGMIGPDEKHVMAVTPPAQYFACPDPYWPSPIQAKPSNGDPIPYNGRFECVQDNTAWFAAH